MADISVASRSAIGLVVRVRCDHWRTAEPGLKRVRGEVAPRRWGLRKAGSKERVSSWVVTRGRQVPGKSTVACLNLAGQAPTCRKVARDLSPNWSACAYNVVKDAIDGIFVENSDVSIGMDVHFERFELEAMLVGFVVKGNGSEVGQIRFRANGGVFGDDDRDVVSLVLVGEGLNIGQWNRDSTLGVPFVIAELGCCSVSLPFLAALPCHPFTPTTYC